AQNSSPVVECLPSVPAVAVSGSEIHASGSTNHFGIRGLQSSVRDRDWSPLRAEYLPFACECSPVVQIHALVMRATASAEFQRECLPLHQETKCLDLPVP